MVFSYHKSNLSQKYNCIHWDKYVYVIYYTFPVSI